MGNLEKFDIIQLKSKYNLTVFVQTGTYKGDGIERATKYNFKRYYSIQCLKDNYLYSCQRFKTRDDVKLYLGYTKEVLPNILDNIIQEDNILFWLDAHLPDWYSNYKQTYNTNVKFPLVQELQIIYGIRKKYKDLIIIDDLSMYEEGQFERQTFPDRMRNWKNNLDNTLNLFKNTHNIDKYYDDSGYVSIIPKGL